MKHTINKDEVAIEQRLDFEDINEDRYARVKLHVSITSKLHSITAVLLTKVHIANLVVGISDINYKILDALEKKEGVKIVFKDFDHGEIGTNESLVVFENFVKKFKDVPLWEAIQAAGYYTLLQD